MHPARDGVSVDEDLIRSKLRKQRAKAVVLRVIGALSYVEVARGGIDKGNAELAAEDVLRHAEQIGCLLVAVESCALGDHRAQLPAHCLLLLAVGQLGVALLELVGCLHLLDNAHLVAELDELLRILRQRRLREAGVRSALAHERKVEFCQSEARAGSESDGPQVRGRSRGGPGDNSGGELSRRTSVADQCVLFEQLVELAQLERNDAVGMVLFDLPVLLLPRCEPLIPCKAHLQCRAVVAILAWPSAIDIAPVT